MRLYDAGTNEDLGEATEAQEAASLAERYGTGIIRVYVDGGEVVPVGAYSFANTRKVYVR